MGEVKQSSKPDSQPPATASSPAFQSHPSRAERYAMGKSLREKCPRASHAAWQPAADRPDPVSLVLKADEGRLPELLPLRHGRMVLSPFTFYRGSALAMAVDLATTPATGVRVQCGGDSHLVNFRGLATPERQVIFAINDLDETLPAPWEWDLKRLAASFVIACRDNGLSESDAKDAALRCVRSYREHMAEFSKMAVLDLWYFAVEAEMLIATIKDPGIRRRVIKRLAKARESSTSEGIFPKLVDDSGGSPLIKDQLPAIFHWKDHPPGEVHPDIREAVRPVPRNPVACPSHVARSLRHQRCRDQGRRRRERRHRLLGAPADGRRRRTSHSPGQGGASLGPGGLCGGERLPEPRTACRERHRLMQPASDIFLGWTEGRLGRHFYVRQLRDVKIKFAVETFGTAEMTLFAQWCGYSLALSHARSGDPAVISGYLGKSDVFDEAVAAFSVAYADQNEKDHAALKRAIQDGKIEAVIEEPK